MSRPSRTSGDNEGIQSVVSVLPALPLELKDGNSALIIQELGTLIPRPPYVVGADILPVGFQSVRVLLLRSGEKVKFCFEISDLGDRPMFVVYCEDMDHRVVALHAAECWGTMIKDIQTRDPAKGTRIRDMFLSKSVLAIFGLSHPEVVQLLQKMLSQAYTALVSKPIPNTSRKRRRRLTNKFSVISSKKKPLLLKRKSNIEDEKMENSTLLNGRITSVSPTTSNYLPSTTTSNPTKRNNLSLSDSLSNSTSPTGTTTTITTTTTGTTTTTTGGDIGYQPYANFALVFNFLQTTSVKEKN